MKIGPHRFAGIVSDSTIVTLKARAAIQALVPTIFNMRDCAHHLHNTIGDINKLEHFTQVGLLVDPL